MERRLLLGEKIRVVCGDGGGHIKVSDLEGNHVSVELHQDIGGSFQVQTSGGCATGEACRDGNVAWVRWDGRTYKLEVDQGTRRARSKHSGDLSSPMPGQVIKHLAKEGATVEAGTPLMVVEAMKMQLEIKAPHKGTIARFLHQEGDSIGAGDLLIDLETSE